MNVTKKQILSTNNANIQKIFKKKKFFITNYSN